MKINNLTNLIMKNTTKIRPLSDFALNIPENEYHALRVLSYSILARYEREGGFGSLPETFDELFVETPRTDALIFGSALDTLVTHEDGWKEYADEYKVADLPSIPDKAKQIIDTMVERGIGWTDTEGILFILDEQSYYNNWKPATRIAKLCECNAEQYYNIATEVHSMRKTLISTEMDEAIRHCYENLFANSVTRELLFGQLPDHKKRYFQLQFKEKVSGVSYKIMCDMIIVDNLAKTIDVYDLKTSGKPSYDFKDSYLKWGYHIQSHLYRDVLREALLGTPYESYEVKSFSFIVASKVNDVPLVWRDDTKEVCRRPWLRSPREIGYEIDSAYSLDLINDNPKERRKSPLPESITDRNVNILTFTTEE